MVYYDIIIFAVGLNADTLENPVRKALCINQPKERNELRLRLILKKPRLYFPPKTMKKKQN